MASTAYSLKITMNQYKKNESKKNEYKENESIQTSQHI